MKKDSLLKMKDLPATEEMLAVAREDVPVKLQPADRVQSKVMPFMVIEHSRRNEQKQSAEKVINEEAQNNRLAADFSEHAD